MKVLAFSLFLGELCCGSGRPGLGSRGDAAAAEGGETELDASEGVDSSVDAATDAAGPRTCPASAAPADACPLLATGKVSACSYDSAGTPSPHGYLEILGADGSRSYVCAVAWVPGHAGGYALTRPARFVANPEGCCGSAPTPATPPATQSSTIGYLGLLHPPTDIKPHETAQPGKGLIRQNPFSVILQDADGGAALAAASAVWHSWTGDGRTHPAPDGSGAYYFPPGLLIDYAILQASDGRPVIVVGPEVALNVTLTHTLGHPTLGACAAGGGAPLVLIAGEIHGTTLTNGSGRFGRDPSVTPEALESARALFNCFGVPLSATQYYPPNP